MDLDELKTNWTSLDTPLPPVNRPRRRVQRIVRFERFGAVGCLAIVVFVLVRFGGLDSPLLRICGVLSVACLVAVSCISWISLRGFDFEAPHAQALQAFSAARARFRKLQKVNIALAMVFITVFLPVTLRLIANKDIAQQRAYLPWMVPLYLVLQFAVSRRLFVHYSASLRRAEEEMSEMGED